MYTPYKFVLVLNWIYMNKRQRSKLASPVTMYFQGRLLCMYANLLPHFSSPRFSHPSSSEPDTLLCVSNARPQLAFTPRCLPFLRACCRRVTRWSCCRQRGRCCALLAFASCVEVPTVDSDGAGGEGHETVELAELARTSHALMQVSPSRALLTSRRFGGGDLQ